MKSYKNALTGTPLALLAFVNVDCVLTPEKLYFLTFVMRDTLFAPSLLGTPVKGRLFRDNLFHNERDKNRVLHLAVNSFNLLNDFVGRKRQRGKSDQLDQFVLPQN